MKYFLGWRKRVGNDLLFLWENYKGSCSANPFMPQGSYRVPIECVLWICGTFGNSLKINCTKYLQELMVVFGLLLF